MKGSLLRICTLAAVAGLFSVAGYCQTTTDAKTTDTNASVQAIERLISRYYTSIDRADTDMVENIFSPEASFIQPRGEERGRAQIETDLYRNLMGETFSKRHLTAKDISVHVYGNTAWAEFDWDFVATVRKDGSAFHSQGRETDIFRREKGQWWIVHVHYSGAPVTGNLIGF